MGGVWGVGAALALETCRARRGFFSGLLQEGYVVGNLLAAALFGLLFPHLHGTGMVTNWRVLFMLGAMPRCSPSTCSSRWKSRPFGLPAAIGGAWRRSRSSILRT